MHDPMRLQHLALVVSERLRCERETTTARLATVAIEAGFMVVHASAPWPRYMFIAPLVALAGWAVEAQINRRKAGLGVIESALRTESEQHPEELSLDVDRVRSETSLWRAVLRPATAVIYHPAAVVGALVAIDAQNVGGTRWPEEPYWYAAVGVLAGVALVAIALTAMAERSGRTGGVVSMREREPARREVQTAVTAVRVEPVPRNEAMEPVWRPFPDTPSLSIEVLRNGRREGVEQDRGERVEGVKRETGATQTFGSVQVSEVAKEG